MSSASNLVKPGATNPRRCTRSAIGHILDACATSHLGLVTSEQLATHGVSRHQQQTLVRNGVLEPIHLGVFRTAGTIMSIRRRLIAACLAADGLVAASHRAALWLWGLSPATPPVEVTIITTRSPLRDQVVVHRSRDLVAGHLTVRRSVPVTTPARTLVDVGCVVPNASLVNAVERALHHRLVTVAELRAMIDEVAGRGRNGVGVLRQLLDERALGDARPESMLEPLMARICKRDIGVEVLYQETLVVDGRILRPDFYVPSAKLVIEIDGLQVHGTRDALDDDLERQNLLVAHGFQVLRYTSTHLRQPDRTANEILRTIRRRRAALSEPGS